METKDTGLKIRMAIVISLMVALYGSFIGILMMTELSIVFAAVLIPLIAVSWKGSDIALWGVDARKVTPKENPEIHNRVSRLSHQAGMSKPDVAISQTRAPNAFATGRSEDSAVVCVTEGMIEQLEGDELDAVLAHELSHIKNRDMTVMMIASAFASLAFFIVRWGWMFDGGGQEAAPIYAAVIASFVVWLGSYVLMRILSSYREFTADRGAAEITGDPLSLVSALEKIEDGVESTPDDDLRTISGTQAMNFYPVETGTMTELMSTHPDAEDRVEKLEKIDKEM
jgi:heat shock protein HtpX